MSDMRVGVIPGSGAVVRRGDMVVVIAGTDPTGLVEQLTDAMTSHTGDARIRAIARVALDHPEPPSLAAVVLESDSSTVFLYGGLDLVRGSTRRSGNEHVLGVTEVLAADEGFGICPEGREPPTLAAWNDLDQGTVRGDGIEVLPATSASATRDEGAATGEVEAQSGVGAPSGAGVPFDPPSGARGEFEPIPLTGDVDLAGRQPLPVAGREGEDEARVDAQQHHYERPIQVVGVYSPRGFFNHPDAKYCSRTGVKMGASHTRQLVEGPRPPLGVLTLDDGSTLTVQWDTLIGRDPSIEPRVRDGLVGPFIVADEAQTVSRCHALLELVDWDVMISDLGSRNGTYVQLASDGEPSRLEPGERRILHSGAVVFLGDRSFVYNEHHVR